MITIEFEDVVFFCGAVFLIIGLVTAPIWVSQIFSGLVLIWRSSRAH